MLHRFDEKRKDLKPYGLTCQLWMPNLMRRPDRHNEIEINYLVEGSITYLIHDKKIKIRQNNLVVFWALVPHQIVDFDTDKPYYVITIPFAEFVSWNLNKYFADPLFQGNVHSYQASQLDFVNPGIFGKWSEDLKTPSSELEQICALEIQALLRRLSLEDITGKEQLHPTESLPMNLVEKMAIYIAENYTSPIKVSDVASSVELHPDYANAVFRKAFSVTISRYLAEQRVSFAKRKLSVTSDSITSIAFESGFNSISRFNATFRKISSNTPRDYRKHVQTRIHANQVF